MSKKQSAIRRELYAEREEKRREVSDRRKQGRRLKMLTLPVQ